MAFFGGLVGCVLLFARQALSVPVFAASLAGYAVLYAGDITEGVFATLGFSQVAILTTVVFIASGLLWLSVHVGRKGLLKGTSARMIPAPAAN